MKIGKGSGKVDVQVDVYAQRGKRYEEMWGPSAKVIEFPNPSAHFEEWSP